jgi:NAD(P)-dependent dehydrogenase (short-subunit alcohol dehydrogenase family)
MANDGGVALVSGSARGIGRAVAGQLLGSGYDVIVTARDERKAAEAGAELDSNGGHPTPARLDVTDPGSVEELARRIAADPGRLDVLVNNAAVYGDTGATVEDASLDEVHETLETNLFGAWRLTQTMLPLLRAGGHGRIVNVSSGAGQLDDMRSGMPSYRVSKVSLNALTRMLANEERGNGILVNSMCPGWVRTDMGGPNAPRSPDEGADTVVWLATLPDDGPTGGFFRDRSPIPW